ncbi:copper chaperone PCu(A)C [Rhizobium sp. 0TCS1.26]
MMTMTTRSRLGACLATLSLATIGVATEAQAHVSFVTATAKPDATVVLQLQVPHGCDGKPTNELRIKLPEGFYAAKPQPKAGWTLEIIKGDYAEPFDHHGTPMTSGAREIRWKGGDLPDDNYDTFVIQGRIAGVASGNSLAFATTQLCGSQTEAWDQVAASGTDPHTMKNPAPVVNVVADGVEPSAQHHDHAGMHAGMDMGAMETAGAETAAASEPEAGAAATATQASLTVSDAYLKAMLPGQPVGGGYLTIANAGSSDDRLLSVTSGRAGVVEMHEMAMNGDVMTMRKLDKGIVVPAGQTVELKPGGLHLMFMQVGQPFKMGETVPVTLSFERAGRIELALPVESAAPGARRKK